MSENQLDRRDLEKILALIEIVLDEDLLDAEPMNSYSNYGMDYERRLDDAWKALELKNKISELLNKESNG